MRDVWTADCETAPFGSKDWESLADNQIKRENFPFVWGVYDGCLYHEFSSSKDFIDYVRDYPVILYAHNGGKFDWHFIIDFVEEWTEVMIIAGRIAKFKIGECEFRDSVNILPISLAQFQKDDIDYRIMERDQRDLPKNRAIISKYLRGDCVYLHRLIMEFIDNYGCNLTLASTALKQWKKISGISSPRTSKIFYDEISEYYYGGRVEAFQTGIFNKPFKIVDINSAYPWAMKKLHPFGSSYNVIDTLPDTDAYISRCFITIKCDSFGAMPIREKTGLSFPDDGVRREFNITGWEYLAARDTNCLDNVEIVKIIQFPDSISFEEYVDHFYKLKTESKILRDNESFESPAWYKHHAKYIFAKLFLNSLYGKFGANPQKYKENIVLSQCYVDAALQDDYDFRAILGKWALMERDLDESKHNFLNVATAASITGCVRAKMWESICRCKGVMYCDTDSIACEDSTHLKMDSEKLGCWDIEADCDRGAIAGKKLYAFLDKHTDKWKIASKGVKFDHNDIYRVAGGETVEYTPIAPSMSVKRGIQFNSRNLQITG